MSAPPLVSDLLTASPPSPRAVLFVHPSAVGAHVGIVYAANDDGARRVLHQAWHYDTRDESLGEFLADDGAPSPRFWIGPSQEDDEQNDVRAMAALIASRIRENQLPYALRRADAAIQRDGRVSLGTSLGLTCATFVTALFDAAQVSLLDEASWDARDAARIAEDRSAQGSIADWLSGHHPAHAKRIRDDEIGCTRIRAEEVAVASGMTPRPVSFANASAHGASLLRRFRA